MQSVDRARAVSLDEDNRKQIESFSASLRHRKVSARGDPPSQAERQVTSCIETMPIEHARQLT
jgi:hypothetical protein